MDWGSATAIAPSLRTSETALTDLTDKARATNRSRSRPRPEMNVFSNQSRKSCSSSPPRPSFPGERRISPPSSSPAFFHLHPKRQAFPAPFVAKPVGDVRRLTGAAAYEARARRLACFVACSFPGGLRSRACAPGFAALEAVELCRWRPAAMETAGEPLKTAGSPPSA